MHKNRSKTEQTCISCEALVKGLNESELKVWIVERLRTIPDLHISETYRGRERQNELYAQGRSRAKFGKSAHNFRYAVDVFFLDSKGKLSYDKKKFAVLVTDLPDDIAWYGTPGAKFPELPHFELKNWKTCAKGGV